MRVDAPAQLGHAILAGTVRRALVGLLHELSVDFEERPFALAEAQVAREAFITSSSGFVLPVTRLDGAPVGEGKVGPAHTHDTAYYFFAPGKGVVAMISQEDATAFWVIHIDTTSGKVLIKN